ncbi:MAG: hypothetical protein HXK91_08665 [Lachnospiraceae bacterium]|nr:hypothetical protein [Lachnospiraceae bacterium]
MKNVDIVDISETVIKIPEKTRILRKGKRRVFHRNGKLFAGIAAWKCG